MTDFRKHTCQACGSRFKYPSYKHHQKANCPKCRAEVVLGVEPTERAEIPVPQQMNYLPCKFEYQMVQLPSSISVDNEQGNEAALMLQNVVNGQASQGWEFFRVDTFGVYEPPGCFGALTGDKGTTRQYHVATFRRPV